MKPINAQVESLLDGMKDGEVMLSFIRVDNAISVLVMGGYMASAARDRARNRLVKNIERQLKSEAANE